MAKIKCVGSRVAVKNKSITMAKPANSWRGNQSSTQRGYGYRWQRARLAFLKKYPLCCLCQDKGLITEATVVDHIVPHQGDKQLFWDSSNWQPLCQHCHSSEKQSEERKR